MNSSTMISNPREAVREIVRPWNGTRQDYDDILYRIGDARFVLIGEATHGTEEFYHHRAEITKRLIQERRFSAVAVEADWPDAYRVNCYVQGRSSAASANEALSGFRRFPTWMWRNTVVESFVEWLKAYNSSRSDLQRTGFYGLDLYSLHASVGAVLDYLQRVDPNAAETARQRYSCFDHYGSDPQEYGFETGFGLRKSCEDDVVKQLMEMQLRAREYAERDGRVARDDYFQALQNARLVRNAEEYYRSMFRGRSSSWNLRDSHMVESLGALDDHLKQQGAPPRIVVWEHNSHLGDARATDMGEMGEHNVGQLSREKWGREAILIGFSTYSGSVTAASSWGGDAEQKRVRTALPNSYESLFHELDVSEFWVDLREGNEGVEALSLPRLERAIGVIYLPQTERQSHYFEARLPAQFDVMIHLDETRALHPLEKSSLWEGGEAPETYPSGL